MWLQTVVLLLAQGILTQGITLVAEVSVGGVMGRVTFTQANPGEQVTVNVNVTGPNAAQASTWQLHTFRLNYDITDRCDPSRLGPRILNSIGGSVTNGDQTVPSGLELSGIDSIEGRSIAFLNTNGNPVACATVESAGEYITARATFRKMVLGHITFRQQKASASSLTRVTLDLYWDGSQNSAKDVEWRVVQWQGTESCTRAATAYNPKSVSGACDMDDHASCAVGDLQGKVGTVSVGVTMGSQMKTVADLNLPLSGADSVLGMTLQLLDSGGQSTPLACAKISAYMTRTGVATFDNDGVTGTITLTQPSPLDPTTTMVDLSNLRSLASGYLVHKYPVPQRISKDEMLCSQANLCLYLNPYDVDYDDNTPAAHVGTEDMYMVGDLGKKYGLLDDSNMMSRTFRDFNLPLFGYNSAMGRSIVIHYNRPNDTRWMCATIHDTEALTSVLATFTFPVIGHVLMQQRAGDPEAETSIYYRLDYGNGVIEETANHSWAVHANPTGPDMLEDDPSARCVSTDDLINPLSVSPVNYDSQCQPLNPLRCKMGDLTSKHKAINVRSGMDPDVGFFTDVNLPLQGPHSVVGKSLVLKDPEGGSQSLACATLRKVSPEVAEASNWGQGTDYGSVTFTQQVGVVQVPTTIDLNLKDLLSYDSVLYSVETGRCSKPGVVYNPFEVSSSGSTKDAIPTGDLAAKFGALSGDSVSELTKVDPSLNVWGPRSVLGRAFSLASAGSSLGCADIVQKAVPGGRLFQAEAVFQGMVTGKITFTQYMTDREGAMAPTTVVVDLRKSSGEQTQNHNWHTHTYTVGDDAEASTGRCASTGGHYNPFKVNVKSNYMECRPGNPMRCELGDQSKKLGTYDMGSGPMVANDVYLPLFGPYGVVGRSIVVHTANKGAPRMACTDIFPVDLTNSMTMSVNPPTFSKADMVQSIADAINIEKYDVTVRVLSQQADCTDARVYFLGMDAKSHVDKFSPLAAPNNKAGAAALGDYKSLTKCGTGRAGIVLASVYLLLASFVMGRLLM